MGESGREGSEQHAGTRTEGRTGLRHRRILGRPRAQQLTVRQVGRALVVHDADAGHGPRQEAVDRFALLLPAEPATRAVLVADGTDLGRTFERLDPVVEHLRDGERLRLVLDGVAARDDASGPVAQLAARIGREVLVPDGPVLLHPGGSLYVTHPDGPQWGAGRWLRYRPGSSPVALGAHYPEPRWIEHAHRTMATAGRIAHGEVLGIPVPAGWMLRRIGSSAERPPGDLSFSVPVNDHWSTVLLGCGDELAPDTDQVAGWLENLPADLRSRVALTARGAGPDRDGRSWPWTVSRALGERIAVWTGVPLADDAGAVRVTICSAAGTPAWCPPAGLVLVSPDGRCDVVAWQLASGTDLPPCAPDAEGRPVTRLRDGWVSEIVPAGLWVRPQDLPASPARRPVLDELPTAERGTLVVGAPGRSVPPGVWSCLPGLVAGAHPQMGRRLGLVVVGEVSVPGLNAVTTVTDRYKITCEFREGLEG